MDCEVVVVGGGIGGLTVAALLAKRGVDVCLVERESQVGGCAAGFEKFGYSFEQSDGIYPLWQPGEIHDQIFSELQVDTPRVSQLEPGYVVRLPDRSDIAITANTDQFEEELRTSFPECAGAATEFYRTARSVAKQISRALRRVPDFPFARGLKQLAALMPNAIEGARIMKLREDTALQHLAGTSLRFKRFVDVQLQTLTGSASDDCAYLWACVALSEPLRGLFAIDGGPNALAETLLSSTKKSGGKVRLNAPVLRLAFSSGGEVMGVDLLSGETIGASRAVVSNLTVWDTYGKLVGLTRTPADIRKRLANLRGWGAYLLYLGMDEAVAERLPAANLITLSNWQDGQNYNPEEYQLNFAAAPESANRAPAGKLAVTVHAFTNVEDWFTYHESESDLEAKDQAMLESCWRQLHAVMPELGDGVEVIDTLTPRGFYEMTRRKLGMVGGLGQSLFVLGKDSISHTSPIANLYLVGDTTFPGAGLAAVSQSALTVATLLTS